MLHKADPTKTKSWRHLSEHFDKTKNVHMRDLFANDPQRFNRFSIRFKDILPFHNMGEHKWEALNLEYQLKNTESPSTDLLKRVQDQFRRRRLTVS